MSAVCLQNPDNVLSTPLITESGIEGGNGGRTVSVELLIAYGSEIDLLERAAKSYPLKALQLDVPINATGDFVFDLRGFNISTHLSGQRWDSFSEVDRSSLFPGICFETTMGSKNQEALKLIKNWMQTPDDLGEKWWQEFEDGFGKVKFGEA